MTITAFLPCRAGSKRVPKKNTKTFAKVDGGLTKIKIEQLLSCPLIDEVLVSTDDQMVLDIAAKFNDSRIRLDKRPIQYAADDTSTDMLIEYVADLKTHNHILWTHVTSPFLNGQDYKNIIDSYIKEVIEGPNDSLMTVTKVQKFLWNKEGAINYDAQKEKWPRSQTLPVWYEVNSGAFVAPKECYIKHKNRIGTKPYLFEMEGKKTMDIDEPSDFELCEQIYTANPC